GRVVVETLALEVRQIDNGLSAGLEHLALPAAQCGPQPWFRPTLAGLGFVVALTPERIESHGSIRPRDPEADSTVVVVVRDEGSGDEILGIRRPVAAAERLVRAFQGPRFVAIARITVIVTDLDSFVHGHLH